jgi:hypothetical protein
MKRRTKSRRRPQIEEAEKALYRIAETSRYGEGPIDFSEACAARWKAREGAGARRRFPASRPALPIWIRCWAACSRPT